MRHLPLFVVIVSSAFPALALGASINMCLSSNGGVLTSGPEAIRDGDWYTPAQQHGGQGGGIEATITFPECSIDFLRYRLGGAAYEYDGGATASINAYLRIDGSWTSIFSWYGGRWDHYDTGIATDNNNGAGWDHVSGMMLYSSVWGSDTGSAGVTHYEMEAWAIPEPATLTLLGMATSFLLSRRPLPKWSGDSIGVGQRT